MSTFLFDKIIFGPVQSRRLGISLGVNVVDPESKLCNFDCIYCECGWNADSQGGKFNDPSEIATRLEQKLTMMAEEGNLPDIITFAGNGEPTLHAEFNSIIKRTIEIRNRLVPNCKIAVLSNATMIDRPMVFEALNMVDKNILKLDSAFLTTISVINRPKNPKSVAEQIELLKRFEGRVIIQTMFLRGEYLGESFDNTSEEEILAWLEALKEIAPQEVMLYSIDRATPASGLISVSKEEMQSIACRVEAIGIKATVA